MSVEENLETRLVRTSSERVSDFFFCSFESLFLLFEIALVGVCEREREGERGRAACMASVAAARCVMCTPVILYLTFAKKSAEHRNYVRGHMQVQRFVM